MDTAATCNPEYILERDLTWPSSWTITVGSWVSPWDLVSGLGSAMSQPETRRGWSGKLDGPSVDLTSQRTPGCSVATRLEEKASLDCPSRTGWLHRYLLHAGFANVVIDADSMEGRKKRRRAKTDRIDLAKLLRMLIRYHAGDKEVWSVVRTLSLEAEDRRQLHRERWALTSERNRHINL